MISKPKNKKTNKSKPKTNNKTKTKSTTKSNTKKSSNKNSYKKFNSYNLAKKRRLNNRKANGKKDTSTKKIIKRY